MPTSSGFVAWYDSIEASFTTLNLFRPRKKILLVNARAGKAVESVSTFWHRCRSVEATCLPKGLKPFQVCTKKSFFEAVCNKELHCIRAATTLQKGYTRTPAGGHH